MAKALLMVFCAIFLFSACSNQSEIGVNPTITIQKTDTPVIETIANPTVTSTSEATEEPITPNVGTITPTETIQPTTDITPISDASPEESSTPSSTETKAIIIDHTSIALFDQIPERYLTAARNLRVMFSDRSVGENISWALDCLASPSWQQSRPACRTGYYDSNWHWKVFTPSDLSAGLVPAGIQYNADSTKYNRNNWTFVFKQGEWSETTQDFIQNLAPAYIDSKDVLSYQFGYSSVKEGDNIADLQHGYFADNPDTYDIYDLETYIGRYPNKIFFFWTTSLARAIGTQVATDFNDQMRQYAREHNKILFDVADIESHTEQGEACYDNRDGVEYCAQNTGRCENNPDDHKNIPAICQDYTTEIEGGHLGTVSGGGIRLAKGFWVLMARIAGWDGVSP